VPNSTSIAELLLILANQHFLEFDRGKFTATGGCLTGQIGIGRNRVRLGSSPENSAHPGG
jgi:hypothetical protein